MNKALLILLLLFVSALSMVVKQDKLMNVSIIKILAAHRDLYIYYNQTTKSYEFYEGVPFLEIIQNFVILYHKQNVFISDYSTAYFNHIQNIGAFLKQLQAIKEPLTEQRSIELASRLLQQMSTFHRNIYQFESNDPGRFLTLLDARFGEGVGTDEFLQKYRKVFGFPALAQMPYTYQYFNSKIRRNTSQYDQDGVIEAIFDLIGIRNKFFVEVGGGSLTDNSYYLRTFKGWDGILFQGGYYFDGSSADPMIRYAMMTSANIIQTFNKEKIPKDFDFLSVDIDGNDFWVTNQILKQYRPSVIALQFNSNFPVNTSATIKNCNYTYKWKDDKYYGCSIRAIYDLAVSHGYSYVYHFFFTDVFFVRSDLLPEKFRGMSIEQTYHPYPLHLMNTNLRPFAINDLTIQDSSHCIYYQDFLKRRKDEELQSSLQLLNKLTPTSILAGIMIGMLVLGFLYSFYLVVRNRFEKELRAKFGQQAKHHHHQQELSPMTT